MNAATGRFSHVHQQLFIIYYLIEIRFISFPRYVNQEVQVCINQTSDHIIFVREATCEFRSISTSHYSCIVLCVVDGKSFVNGTTPNMILPYNGDSHTLILWMDLNLVVHNTDLNNSGRINIVWQDQWRHQ